MGRCTACPFHVVIMSASNRRMLFVGILFVQQLSAFSGPLSSQECHYSTACAVAGSSPISVRNLKFNRQKVISAAGASVLLSLLNAPPVLYAFFSYKTQGTQKLYLQIPQRHPGPSPRSSQVGP